MFSWFRELSATERKGFYGAFLGHAVDVFDFMIYTFLIPTLLLQWSMSKSEAGAIVAAGRHGLSVPADLSIASFLPRLALRSR